MLVLAACDGVATEPVEGPVPAVPPTRSLRGTRSPAPPAPPAPPGGAARGQPVRHIVVAGGAFPESSEASLEFDAALAHSVLPGPGRVLFAGGSAARAVRSLDPSLSGTDLLTRVGDIFAPRSGRRSAYRRPRLAADAAGQVQVEAALAAALGAGVSPTGRDGAGSSPGDAPSPLLLYVATHGEQGEQPADNWVALWGGGALTVRALVALHDAHPAPLRAVVASCFAGGFAEMAFAQADPARGPAGAPRCGLFAGTWDRQTAGCDPDPDRRAHRGYSVHFLNALRGLDRHGRPLGAEERVDLDGDGAVSLLEAHARARAQSRSIDVPTTTSERLLRALAPELRAGPRPDEVPGSHPPPPPPAAEWLPEDAEVLRVLGAELGLADAAAARARAVVVDARLDALDGAVAGAEARVDTTYQALAARLLGRFPVLDDPYHPGFASMFEAARAELARLLDEAPEAQAHADAQAALDAADARYWQARRGEALLTRYLRAAETLELAAGLKQRGGPGYRAYRRLLECERYVPSKR